MHILLLLTLVCSCCTVTTFAQETDASTINPIPTATTITTIPAPTCSITACGLCFPQEEARQIISSPSYPDNYPANFDGCHKIEVRSGARIHLTFVEFEMDPNGCDDHISVYDGPIFSPLLFHSCTEGPTSPIISSGNTITIRFTTDSVTGGGRGFRIKYIQLEA